VYFAVSIVQSAQSRFREIILSIIVALTVGIDELRELYAESFRHLRRTLLLKVLGLNILFQLTKGSFKLQICHLLLLFILNIE